MKIKRALPGFVGMAVTWSLVKKKINKRHSIIDDIINNPGLCEANIRLVDDEVVIRIKRTE